jgi:hypothetical protein
MLYKYKDVTYKYIDQIKSCITIILGPLWSLLYDLWIYNYLFNQCVSPLTLWVRLPLMARCTIMWYSLSMNCDRSVVSSTGARGTDHPPFSNFPFTNLFSIKFLYFFIISSLFPYFNLFVWIFIQSYVNIKLHVSTLYRYCMNIDTNKLK